jgi:signal peptidase
VSEQAPVSAVAQAWAYLPSSRRQRDVGGTKGGSPGRVVRWALVACLWTVLGSGAGILLSVSVPLLFGYRTFIVLSGSMEPAIHTGDVVVDRQIAPEEVQVGDVITYRDPDRQNRLITHRVRGMRTSEGKVYFVTQGDANTDSQKWTTATGGTVGVVRLRVVKLGYVLFYVNRPIGRLVMIVVPILLLSANEIMRIWRKKPKPKENRVVVWA